MTDHRCPEFVYKITHIHPIEAWPKYRACMEYSDKLVLPYSILLAIRRTHQPLPPLFQISLIREKSLPLITGVLHFSSEEQHAYFPSWILRRISFGRHKKDELYIELLPVSKANLYPFPPLKRVEIYMEILPDYEQCKQALCAYSILTKGDWMKIMIEEKVYRIYIVAVFPKNKCIIKDGHFDISVRTFIPKVLIKQDLIKLKKTDRKVMSFEKTKSKFYEVLKSRGFDSGHVSTPLQTLHPRINNQGAQQALRYTSLSIRRSEGLRNDFKPRDSTLKIQRTESPPSPITKERKPEKNLQNEALDLLPWGQDDHNFLRGYTVQTTPMPSLTLHNFSHQKFLELMKKSSNKVRLSE
ncbi:hypothetical protein SteCoe_32469 [Stentor coeruleus]|uniref:Ubiquitin fusion degradation protein UFD1 N-terminal subdomain 1 domain-containing protein n=1 Tax=Stentor coeruleus TaxID=5963 RepID=A0A1R2AZ12_9CILI|nr:hypothetical protein SteCoe_32469 [Stentor coeruleus]